MRNLRIRDVRTDDLGHLLELNQSNLPHVSSVSLRDLERFHTKARYFRVAESGGKVAGFLIAFDPAADYGSPNFLWFRDRYKAFIYIDRIITAAEARREGIALRLYKDLEMFARERGIPMMTCEYNLRPKNEESRLFHQKYGFEEVGIQETEGGKKTVSLQIKRLDWSLSHDQPLGG
jgi:predicted GNAT superfamily acetyltransferase